MKTKTEKFLAKPKVWGRPDTFSSAPTQKKGYTTVYTEIDPRSIPGGEMVSRTRRRGGSNAEKSSEWGDEGIK